MYNELVTKAELEALFSEETLNKDEEAATDDAHVSSMSKRDETMTYERKLMVKLLVNQTRMIRAMRELQLEVKSLSSRIDKALSRESLSQPKPVPVSAEIVPMKQEVEREAVLPPRALRHANRSSKLR